MLFYWSPIVRAVHSIPYPHRISVEKIAIIVKHQSLSTCEMWIYNSFFTGQLGEFNSHVNTLWKLKHQWRPQNQLHDLPFIKKHHSPMYYIFGIIMFCIVWDFYKVGWGDTKQVGKLFPKTLKECVHWQIRNLFYFKGSQIILDPTRFPTYLKSWVHCIR